MTIANLSRQIQLILKKKVENFHKNWQIFDESALFKGMKHVTQRRAEVESGIKLFVGPRASILAIIDIYGLKR